MPSNDIFEWNQSLPSHDTSYVHHLFEQRVQEQPDHEAVCSPEGSLTYRELDERANRLASRLVKHGVEANTLVPLCFEHSLWTLVAMVAVSKAGGAFVSIPCSPLQRTKLILGQLNNPNLILASTSVAESLQILGVMTWVVDANTTAQVADGEFESFSQGVVLNPNDLSYVIFTSGSTGIPKVLYSLTQKYRYR